MKHTIMKKILIILILISTFGITYAQKEYPSKFEYIQTDEYKEWEGIIWRVNDVIVTSREGTAKELYNKVLDNIKDIYNNPSEVITAQTEGKFIKISGVASNNYKQNVIGTISYNDVNYNIEFYFRDGRVKVELSRLDVYFPPSQYSSGGYYDIKDIAATKKNGKIRTRYKGTAKLVSEHFNNLVERLFKDPKVNNSVDDDW